MLPLLGPVILAGLAAATSHASGPCYELSKAYDQLVQAGATKLISNLPPSVGIQCLRSVPLAKERDIQLLEYLRPYVSFQSTIGDLANPPETYLIPGVDIWGGFDAIEQKLKNNGYVSQYDVMVDLRSIFWAAADNHFGYHIALFRQFSYARHGLNMTSLSADGLAAPQVYMAVDVENGNHGQLTYHPSHVVSVDGVPVVDFLARDATLKLANAQDPDAQYNALFDSIPLTVAGRDGSLTSTQFDIPDTYTIQFLNGSTLIVNNYVEFTGANLTGITSGEDFQNRFEIPPPNFNMNPAPARRSFEEFNPFASLNRVRPGPSGRLSHHEGANTHGAASSHATSSDPTYEDGCTEEDDIPLEEEQEEDCTAEDDIPLEEEQGEDCTEEDDIPLEEEEGSARTGDEEGSSLRSPVNYPEPFEMNSYNNVATFFLDDEGYEDVAILSVLSFSPIGVPDDQIDQGEYIHGASLLVEHFVAKARETGRTKLVLDLSANTGGHIILADELYRLLFPSGEFTSYDRMPANDALRALSQVDFASVNEGILGNALKPDGTRYTDGAEWFGPHTVQHENVTSAFLADRSGESNGGFYINGFDANPVLTEPYFSPEDIIIVTDGVCASACTILTGQLTRNYNVRTLALGGRPFHAPMQVMGGVRGTIVHQWNQVRSWFDLIRASLEGNQDALAVFQNAAAAIPSSEVPPLLPAPVDGGFGAINGRNGHAKDDVDGVPFHFQYQAANCRLFYTQLMQYDIREVWRRAAGVAWKGARCVDGSTVNADQTISNELLPYTRAVRSTAPELEGPGALHR